MFEVASPAPVTIVECEAVSAGVFRTSLPALPSAIPVCVGPLVILPEPLVVRYLVLILRQLGNDVHIDEDALLLSWELPQVNGGIPPEGLVPERD